MEPILKVINLTKKFGGLIANENISFSVNEGEIVSIIGPNGAGKTTLFNCLTGFQKPESGSVIFYSHKMDGMPPNSIARKGLVRTFQIVQTFAAMTILDNVMIGALIDTRDLKTAENRAIEVLNFTGLIDKKDSLGKNLTIADKKRLEIARAIAARPKMLLLDECIAGLNSAEVKQAVELLQRIKDSGVTLLIVEHVMEVIMPISTKVVVLDYGKKIAEGKPQEIALDEKVIKAYLGDRYNA
jgi:branched-chain amino acid transport system ATP-binding protein